MISSLARPLFSGRIPQCFLSGLHQATATGWDFMGGVIQPLVAYIIDTLRGSATDVDNQHQPEHKMPFSSFTTPEKYTYNTGLGSYQE